MASFPDAGLLGILAYILAGPSAVSVALLVLASFQRNREGSRWMAPALASYAVLIMRMEPFVEIWDGPQLLVGVGAIIPPLLCFKSLVRSRRWIAVCGLVLFSATSVACLSFNAMANSHGVVAGFFAQYRHLWCR